MNVYHASEIASRVVARKGDKVVLRCPNHDDHRPSAVVFASGLLYCSVCGVLGPVEDVHILFGSIPPQTHTPDLSPAPGPTPAQRRLALALWNKPFPPALEVQRERFAQAKRLPVGALGFTRPDPQGLRFPLVDALGIVGVVYRRKDVLPDPGGVKAITRGFRGFFVPPRELRPAWAWRGKGGSASRRVAVVCESPQAALKVAVAFGGEVLGIATLGAALSRWQREQLPALGARIIRVCDPDRAGKDYAAVFLDTDPLTPDETRKALERYVCAALESL